MRTPVVVLLAAACPLAIPAVSPGQEEPAGEGFAEELVVTEVLLDVVVTDKQDNIILGLGADDFVVSEEGEVVEVTSIAFYSSKRLLDSPELLARQGVEVEVVPQDRHFVVFVQSHRGHGISSLTRQMEVGRQLSKWLVEEAQPADRFAVVSFDRGLKVHQDFTTDREALLRAIDDAMRGRDPERIPPSRRLQPVVDPPAFSSLPTGKVLRKATRDIYRGLKLVGEALQEVPGRKNLLFLGRGFGETGTYGSYQRESFKLNPAVDALNDANVAVYTLDMTPPGVNQNLQVSLRDLAAETGGRFYWDKRSFKNTLEQISDLTSGYYLLSYQSRRPAGEAGYQRVRVGTRSREFRIQARQGYLYGTDPAAQ